ncbi:MAG: cyclase family protein [Acidobacteria bacterium]|nr:cyclase family protein [Acidobacteriota bacterium]
MRIERRLRIDRGDTMNLSQASMSLHTGTHMDAPMHFLREGKGLDTMPLEATVGRARIIEVQDGTSIKAAEIAAHRIHPGERILFKTRNSARCWTTPEFVADFVHIANDAARLLAEARALAVGIDYISVGSAGEDGDETHRILLRAGIWIIEGLDLSKVGPGDYELICLPLKVVDADGAPARAIVRPL